MTAGGATAAASSRSRRWTLLLQGLAWTLVCLWAGEWLARVAPLGLTGSVAGMLLLLVSLNWPALREPVAAAATLLLGHLSLLFIPISVGLMIHGELLSRYGGRLLIATDVELYFRVMTQIVRDTGPAFVELPPPPASEPKHDMDYLTNFERKFRKEGRQIPPERALEHVFGDAVDVPALEPRVVLDADPRQHGRLFSAKDLHAPVAAIGREARSFRRDARSP